LCMRPQLRAHMANATVTLVGFPEEDAQFWAAAS